MAAANGKVLDGLVAYEFDKVERTRREVYIYDLAVAAEHRRRHLATGLRVNGGGILGRSAE